MHPSYAKEWEALLQALASIDPTPDEYLAALDEMLANLRARKISYECDRE